MQAKAEVYGNDLSEAEKTLQSFFSEHAASKFVADAHYTQALLHLKRDESEKGCASLVEAFRSSGSAPSTVREETVALLDETVNHEIGEQALLQFINAAKQPAEEEFLRLKLAEKHILTGNRVAARSMIDALHRRFPQPAFPGRMSALEEKLLEPMHLKLGVLLPAVEHDEQLGAREKEVGQGLLEGIETAVGEFLGKVNVSLVTRSSHSDAAAAAREFASDGSVIAILGPAFSAVAQEVAPIATELRVPILTPTANANGIAASGEFMFQANPDLEMRAKAIAQYAVKNLKLKRLAILGSSDPSSKALAEGFTREVQRLGADIVATEWYERGATNLLKQLTNLRRKGNSAASEPYLSFNESMTKSELAKLSRLGISMKVLDTLKAKRNVVNMTDFLGEEAESKLASLGIAFSNGDPRIDSVQRIVTAIQGLYCPISSAGEISIITSQLAFYGIRTKLLGSGEWNNAAELNANKRYCRGVVFESDYNLDTKSAAYVSFSSRFIKQHNKVPNKFAVLGYDAAKMLLSVMQQGAATREQMRDALSNVSETESLHAKYNLTKGRVNSWLHIFQYTGDGIKRISEISVE
jgi:ABC-type branched-subunit amino acid transport system substrate-binding protein